MSIRRFLACVLFLLASSTALATNTWGTDVSDLWWNPNESGWGAELMHQGDTVFMTMYVYGADGKAKWYAATSMQPVSTSGGVYVFSGQLAEFSGPPIGTFFNSSSVGSRLVGSATLTLNVASGTLSYTIDGVNSTKQIQRFAFRTAALSGSYYGAAIATLSGCGSNSGTFQNTAAFTINQVGSSVAIAASLGTGITCNYSGTYSQFGRMGQIDSGSLTCSNGGRGTFHAFEIEAGYQGLFLRYTADYGGGCTETGRIGGMKQ